MPAEKPYIEYLELSGFKSIRHAELSFGKLNVLIGANGSGKSNLLSFFALLRASLDYRLDGHVGRYGGADSFLHLGAKRTNEIVGAITVRTRWGVGTLQQRLSFGAPDKLVFGDHIPGLEKYGAIDREDACAIGRNGKDDARVSEVTVESLRDRVEIYHFCDTSLAAPARRGSYVEDNRVLRPDAGNLAPFLYRLQQTNSVAYQRIVSTVRMVAPFFQEFDLAPRKLDPRQVLLNWRQPTSDYLFGPHQLSDGTVRCMALIALLLQSEDELPDLIAIDEPELGLHPYALGLIASLLESASHHSQILVSTQSPSLLDHFDPANVILVERDGPASIFKRVNADELASWLDDYSLGEVWEKNVLGGGPY